MPNPDEVATIIVDGQRYAFWKGVQITRTRSHPVSECVVTLTEIGDSHQSFQTMRFNLNQKAQVYLGSWKVIDGVVCVRQAAFTPEERGLQITILSNLQNAVVSTSDVKPGQFKDQTFEQIAKSVLGPQGLSFSWRNGTPAGADMKFPRVNLWVGEPIFSFLERLSRQINVQLTDDSSGNLSGIRPSDSASTAAAMFREGVNIKSARAILRNDGLVSNIKVVSQTPGSDTKNGNDVRANSGDATNSAAPQGRTSSFIAEECVDKNGCQMRAAREQAENVAKSVQVSVVVRGWFDDGGKPWTEHVNDAAKVTVCSPILFPTDKMDLYFTGVTCRQTLEGGTESEIELSMNPESPVQTDDKTSAGNEFSQSVKSSPGGTDT